LSILLINSESLEANIATLSKGMPSPPPTGQVSYHHLLPRKHKKGPLLPLTKNWKKSATFLLFESAIGKTTSLANETAHKDLIWWFSVRFYIIISRKTPNVKAVW